MAYDNIRERTTNVGGVLKRIWYAMTGTTQGLELASLDDAGKFKCVSEQVSGLAGTGNRMVVADSTGNLSAGDSLITTTGEAGKLIKVDNNGNIGLGVAGTIYGGDAKCISVSSPTTSGYLDVYYAGIRKGYIYSSETDLKITTTTATDLVFGVVGEDEAMRIMSNGTRAIKIASLVGTGNRAVYSDASGVLTNTSSDERVKKNIENITDNMNVLDVLKNIRGVTYNWNNTIEGYEGAGEQQEIGVIAQEIEQYIPQVVGENATGYKSVDYAKLVAFLIETNKALLGKVEILESKVV